MQAKIIMFPGAVESTGAEHTGPDCGPAQQVGPQDSAQVREYAQQAVSPGGAQGQGYAQQPVPQDGAQGPEYAAQAVLPDIAQSPGYTRQAASERSAQSRPRTRRPAPKHAAPRHARPAHVFAQYNAPRAAVLTALPAPRSLRAVRAAARRRKRRRQQLLLLAGVVLAVVLILVLRAMFPTAPAPQLPEEDDQDAYVPAVAIPQEGPPYTVAIDAGHGGTDVGAQGVVDENVMTEMTVGFLESWLLQDENYTPVRTHAYDTFMENAERAATANQEGASLLISVHGNSDPYSEKSYGFECYPQPPGRTYHEESIRFAHLIAGKFGAQGQRLRGIVGVRYIYYVGDDAHGYQKEVIEENDSTVRTEQTFGLLEKTDCPAVLAEQCFVTSPADVDSWGDEDGCRLAARLYYEAICAYFGTEPLAQE